MYCLLAEDDPLAQLPKVPSGSYVLGPPMLLTWDSANEATYTITCDPWLVLSGDLLQQGGLHDQAGHHIGIQVGGGPAVLVVPALLHGNRSADADARATVGHAPAASTSPLL